MILSRKPELIILDFDGCIVDSTEDAINFLYESIREESREISRDVIKDCLQGTFDETIDSIIKNYPEESKDLLDPKTRKIVKLANSSKLIEKKISRLFPIIPFLLKILREEPIKIGVLSRTSHRRIIDNLEYYDLLKYFDSNLIFGENNLPKNLKPKPSPDGLNYIIKISKIKNRHNAYFLGDHENDYLAAKSANIQFLGCGWAGNLFFSSSVIFMNTLLDFFIFGLTESILVESNEIINKIKKGQISFFIGAGFSLDAGLEGWGQLVQSLTSHDSIPEGDLPYLIQKYLEVNRDSGKSKIFDYIRRNSSSYRNPPVKHLLLPNFNLNRIWTTNYDSLIEDSFKLSPEIIVNDHDLAPFEERTQVIKIHGSINSVNTSDLVLSTESFLELKNKKPELLKELNTEILQKSFLFIGTSFTDDLSKNIIQCYHNSKRIKPIHYIIGVKDIPNTLKQINQVYIPFWSTMEELFKEWNWKIKNHTVVISGAYVGSLNKDEKEFLFYLGAFLFEAGFIIKIGNGIGIANYILDGVTTYCMKTKKNDLHRSKVFRYNRVLSEHDFTINEKINDDSLDRIKRLISLQPVGTTVYIESEIDNGNIYENMRKRKALFKNVDICIAIGGNVEQTMLIQEYM